VIAYTLILLSDWLAANHETAPKHLRKRFSMLLDAPHFYLTIMGGVDVQGDTVGIDGA
jgi:hypothetical protein